MTCIDCGHPLRPRGVKAADAPGTYKRQPGPRCTTCYETAPRLGVQRATECKGCKRALRPTDVPLVDMPGTVPHKGNGQCASCWRGERGESAYRRETRPTHCQGCGSAVRPNHSDPSAYPGTIRYVGRGMCITCHTNRKARAAEKAKPKPVVIAPEPAPKPEKPITDPGVLRFQAEREKRKRAAELRAAHVEAEAVRRRFIASRRAA